MSRGGGRGRGRGGRGGGRRVNNVPWEADESIVLDGKPSELFPVMFGIPTRPQKLGILTRSRAQPYDVPQTAPLTNKEKRQLSYFLLFREQVHEGPLYTQARAWTQDPADTTRAYGQDQINKRYGGAGNSKATVDAFLAMPTYSQRFEKVERALPDLGSRPFAKEFFPKELHATLDGEDGSGPPAKRRKTGPAPKKTLALSNVTSLRTAEDVFMDQDGIKKVLQSVGDEGEDGLLSGDDDDDDWIKNPEGEDGVDGEDEDQYQDASDDDYNAEQYFEDGEENLEDAGDEGGGDGEY